MPNRKAIKIHRSVNRDFNRQGTFLVLHRHIKRTSLEEESLEEQSSLERQILEVVSLEGHSFEKASLERQTIEEARKKARAIKKLLKSY